MVNLLKPADKAYNQTAESITPGTSSNTWVAFSSNIFTGGDGLSFNNNIFSLNVDDSTVEIVSDIARVKASGITDPRPPSPPTQPGS
jgi:hypothetical protein